MVDNPWEIPSANPEQVVKAIEGHITNAFGFPVVTATNLTFNQQGSFNGLCLALQENLDPHERLFNLLHLSGHMIQCLATDPDYRQQHDPLIEAQKVFQEKVAVDLSAINTYLDDIYQYELIGNCYGAKILENSGHIDLLPWYDHYSAADLAMVIAWYYTEQRVVEPIEKFWENVEPMQLTPTDFPVYEMRLIEGGIAIG